MARKRWYNDGCAASHALDLIGDRWALPVVRELLLGPKRFTDLRAGLPGASPDMLSQRLRELQETGIVRRHKLPPPAAAWVYELTDWGADLATVVTELGRWAARSPLFRPDAPRSVDALMLSLRTTFSREAAAGVVVDVELRLGEDRFRVRIADGEILVGRGGPEHPDVTFDADSHTFDAILYGGTPLAEALESGALVLAGSRETAEQFLTYFPFSAEESHLQPSH